MFPYIVLISASLLAGCAAWFSVSGITQLFPGAGLSAGIMAVALEFGKIVGVSFLYRHRHEIPRTLKTYMWIGTVILMLITSIGIYGYLSSAYATAATGIQQKQNEIELYKTQQNTLNQSINRLTNRSSQLQNLRTQQENRVDDLIRLNRSTTTQQRIIREQDSEINKLNNELLNLEHTRDSISLLTTNTTSSIATTGKIGTFYYVAQTLNVPLDTIVKWFIVLLVVVFDPMSISLFLAYNVITGKKLTTPKLHNVDSVKETEVNDVIKLSNIPYYMDPNYDWNTDTRWHNDPDARGFKGTLGY